MLTNLAINNHVIENQEEFIKYLRILLDEKMN